MNYVIFSVDNSRKLYTDAIRARLGESFWFQEESFKAVDGRVPEELAFWQNFYKIPVKYDAKVGQLGIWYSVLAALEYSKGPLLTFEDDAMLHPNFNEKFWTTTSQLPKDADAFSLFLPRDQDHVYNKSASQLTVSLGISKAYQVYGGVSMFWTESGINKFWELVHRDGITAQWDEQLYQYGRNGEMNVYTQTPGKHVLVSITGREDSIVQETKLA